MFVTNGNRRPKPALKLTAEKTPSLLRDIQRLMDDGAPYGAYHYLKPQLKDEILAFRKTHANKHLIAFLGNQIKGKKGEKQVEVSLYALPKRSVKKVENRYRGNPVVHLRSDFVFEDKDVGADAMVTLLVDSDQAYHAYESDKEAQDVMESAPASTVRLGRFPCVMQDGKLHVALPLAGHHTRKDYVARQQEAKTPRITLTKASSKTRGRIQGDGVKRPRLDIMDASASPNKPLKASVIADMDIEALPDGRYRAIRDGVYHWLIKSSLKAGTINLETLLLLAHDDPNAAEVPLNELPGGPRPIVSDDW